MTIMITPTKDFLQVVTASKTWAALSPEMAI
jgi:hypothetical protein